jgi:hypothetical protein
MLKLRYGKEIQKPLTAEQEAAKLAEQEAAKLAEQEAAKLAALATSTPVALATVAPDQSTTQQIIPRIKVV